jgi:hypothetical protein
MLKTALAVLLLASCASALKLTPSVLGAMAEAKGFEVAVKSNFFLGNTDQITLNSCSVCDAGEEMITECTITEDTVCGAPGSGAGWGSKQDGGPIQMFRPYYTHSPANSNFNKALFPKPIVMLSPPTRRGGDPAVVRMEKGDSNVKVAIIESPDNDFPHTQEWTDVVVFEAGKNYDDKLYFNIVETNDEWADFTYPSMGNDARVVCTIQSSNNEATFSGNRNGKSRPWGFAVPQVKDVTATSAKVRVVTDRNGGRAVDKEEIACMAVTEGSGTVRGLKYNAGKFDAQPGVRQNNLPTGISEKRAVFMQPVTQNNPSPYEVREFNNFDGTPNYSFTLEAARNSPNSKGETVHWFALQRGASSS